MWEFRKNTILSILIILILSLFLTVFSFYFVDLDMDLFFVAPYIENINILALNFLPIFVFMILVFSLTKKLSISFLLSSLLTVAMGITNLTKIFYRDEPFKFQDLILAGEAKDMVERDFKLQIPENFWTFILIILSIIFILIFLDKDFKKSFSKKSLTSLLVLNLFISIFATSLALDPKIYNKYKVDGFNEWLENDISKSQGMIYPFFHSFKDLVMTPPDGYNKFEVKKTFSKFDGKILEEDQKINIIAIMLESFNDLSELSNVDFILDPYYYFRVLKNNSISGKLVVNIFGGGTINSERCFLSGMAYPPRYDKKEYSIVRYLKDNGYTTESYHPNTGKFYRRDTANINMGFEKFFCNENLFGGLVKQGLLLPDSILKKYIIDGFEKNKSKNKPYFGFTVTIQNHGPYYFYKPEKYFYENKYNIDERFYNTTNNYLVGIEETTKFMYDITDYFKNESRPTAVIFFGDHNPNLGPNDEGFKSLGINIDSKTKEGFLKKYETPYILWANDSLKKKLNKDFFGVGPTLSPMNLFPYVFSELQMNGDAAIEYKKERLKDFPVYTKNYSKYMGEFIPTEELDQEIIKEMFSVDYHLKNKKIK